MSNLALSQQSTQTVGSIMQTQATIAIPSQTIEQPSAWMRNGTSPAEFILAIAFIIVAQSLANWSIAGIIHALKSRK